MTLRPKLSTLLFFFLGAAFVWAEEEEVEESGFEDVDKNAGLGFCLVIAAGLSTALGAAAVYVKRLVQLASKPVLAAGLGFSGGVMLYVSFIEIFGKSNDAFVAHGYEENNAYLCATVCFFAGVLCMKILGWIVHRLDPDHNCDDIPGTDAMTAINQKTEESTDATAGVVLEEQPQASETATTDAGGAHGTSSMVTEKPSAHPGDKAVDDVAQEAQAKASKDKRLHRMGLNTALAIAIHNFPEGLATFVATLADPAVGMTLAFAIAMHNIPEGLCVALPVYYSTGNRHGAFLWALLSGLSEPIGAAIGYAVIKATGEDLNQIVYGVLFGLVAGMMVAIVVMELLPTALRYDPSGKYVTNSLFLGMFVMAGSLLLFLY
jgi:ZIP family zinc transporter